MIKPGTPRLLKFHNRTSVLELFRNSDLLTAVDIANHVNISKITIMKILRYLLKEGLIISAGKGNSSAEGGKPPELFKFNETYKFAIGCHIRSKSVLSAITDLQGNILQKATAPLRPDEDIQLVINTIADNCRELLARMQVNFDRLIGIGIGVPGIIDFSKGTVMFSPWFPSWGNEVDFADRLKSVLGIDVPVMIDNESRFQVLSEKLLGAGKNKQNIVTISGREGLVAGIIVKNEIKRGAHHLAGEIGHMVVNPEDKEKCVCGSHGCFEAQVYESRLLKNAQNRFHENPDSYIFKGVQPKDITAERIFKGANLGDKLAQELMDGIIRWYAIAISNIIMMVDPEIIVIQGVYATAGPYFIDNLRRVVNRLVLPKIKKDVEIQYSTQGMEAHFRGASLFVISEYFQKNRLMGEI